MTSPKTERLNILLIEDRPEGVRATRQALENAGLRCRFHTVGSGPAAFDYLHRSNDYEDVPTPDLIFIDFCNPTDKYTFLLKKIKSDKEIGKIPIVVLCGSDSAQKLAEAYKDTEDFTCFSPMDLDALLGTARSLRLDRFLHAIRLIGNLGFVLARMPQEAEDEFHNHSALA